jgi:hypothetical protein
MGKCIAGLMVIIVQMSFHPSLPPISFRKCPTLRGSILAMLALGQMDEQAKKDDCCIADIWAMFGNGFKKYFSF